MSLGVWLPILCGADSVYETQGEFLNRAFNGSIVPARVMWLSGEVKDRIRQLLGHDYPLLRLRYWCQADRSAWLLEEVGKELPITVGVIVDGDAITNLRVLVYRENRGGEVSVPSFTDQFNGSRLVAGDKLDLPIDGISGATLSVQALTRLAKMALYLHAKSGCNNGA